VQAGVAVVLGASYTGALVLPQKAAAGPTIIKHSPQDAAQWHALAQKTKIKLRMPTSWVSGYSYDWSMSRAYTISSNHGGRGAVAVVGTTGSGGYWHIEETNWLDAPAIASPDGSTVVKGVRYLQFYDGAQLHLVAWKIHRTLYWVSNTLDNELGNDTMMGIATSFTGVK
jgi:surface antigen